MVLKIKYHGIIGDLLSRKAQTLDLVDDTTIDNLQSTIIGGNEHARSILKLTRS